MKKTLCWLLLAAAACQAQSWRLAFEVSYRCNVKRPGVSAAANDGSLLIADDYDASILRIDAEDGRQVRWPTAGWQFISDMKVLENGDVCLLDRHEPQSYRLNEGGQIVAFRLWDLPEKHYLAQILDGGDWGELVVLRQAMLGPARQLKSYVLGRGSTASPLLMSSAYDGGEMFRLITAGQPDTLGLLPWGRDCSYSASPEGGYIRIHNMTGKVYAGSMEGDVAPLFRFEEKQDSPGPFTLMQYGLDKPMLDKMGGMPKNWPAVRKHWIDGQGRLWLASGQWDMKGARQFEKVWIYDLHGSCLGELDLSFEPAAFFKDRVFMVALDEQRNQTVIRRYRLVQDQ